MEEKVHNNYFMGFDKLESCPHENQIPYGDMDFSKKGFKSNRFRLIVWSQNFRFFFKGFPAKFGGLWLVLHFQSLSLPTLSTSYPAGCEVKVKK